MTNFRSIVCFVSIFAVSSPSYASQDQQEPPIVREFQEHPVGYTLIGIGGLVSFFGFSGLFAGGQNPAYTCQKDDRRKTSESEQECRDRVSKQNEKFYRTMAGVLGSGLVLVGTGGGMILWKNSRSEDSDTISFEIYDKVPTLTYALALH